MSCSSRCVLRGGGGWWWWLEFLVLYFSFFFMKSVPIFGEGNGTPLQHSCLENPMDGGACSPWGREKSDMTEQLPFHFSLSCIGEGNGNPLQCSCLENPKGSGAWWAAVYGVTQSRTWLKRLSSSSSIPILGYMIILPCFCWPLYLLLLFIFKNHLWPGLDCQMLLAALSSSVNP